MMAVSQNGWPVAGQAAMDESGVAGVTFPHGVLAGDVATVLHYVARRFHAEVEPLKAGQCWGWFVRQIRGATAISNHSSGTAIDLNAPAHPLGEVGTFHAGQRIAIERILEACGGVVRWGGHYAGRKDEMHFEIVKSSAEVAHLADRIRKGEVDDLTRDEMVAVLTLYFNSENGQAAIRKAFLNAPLGRTGPTVGVALQSGFADVEAIKAAVTKA